MLNDDTTTLQTTILQALERIKKFIHTTPIIHSETLNEMLGAKIYFKAEGLQKTGAFKVRGVLNHLLVLKEQNRLPDKVVAYSTGNHGIGVAWASKMIGIKARIYLPRNTALVKQKQAANLAAEVIYTSSRSEAEERAFIDSNNGFYYLHPSDSDLTIAGAGTVCYEAIKQIGSPIDAIFASCGGGGLLSGCFLAKEELDPRIKLIGSEPTSANDAWSSVQNNNIIRFKDSPDTIADGLRTLGISERTFKYLKKLDEFLLVEEEEIKYWTIWLIHLLKVICEPSCAISMAAAFNWLKRNRGKNVLVILSGGNLDFTTLNGLFDSEYLLKTPGY